MLRVTFSAFALVALAACSSSAAPVEPEPGELDYDIAVTRMAIAYDSTEGGMVYNPWTNEVTDREDPGMAAGVSSEVIEGGLDILCDLIDSADDESVPERWYYGAVAQRAVNGAVVASASDEFREAYGIYYLASTGRQATEDAAARQEQAAAALRGDLNGEWVELFELQTTLERQAMTVEGAQAAQGAIYGRCELDLPQEDVAGEPAQPVDPWALSPPAQPAG
ncbi:hypothetical protein [Demequina activiva]|nr:hypothetical protein [Demequina activiva]